MRIQPDHFAAVASLLLLSGALTIQTSRAAIVAASESGSAEEQLDALGALKADLDLWLRMDSTEKGSVAWSRHSVKVVASSEVEVKSVAGQRWLNFQQPGALLKFEPALQIGTSYTLSTWMLLPAPHRHAVVWQGAKGNGSPLFVSDTGLYGWNEARGGQFTFGPLPKGVTGWHHFAVACDGQATTAFLDGQKLGTVPAVLSTNILSIGNHWMQAHQGWMMCDGLADQLLFHRPLSEAEVRKVMKFGRAR